MSSNFQHEAKEKYLLVNIRPCLCNRELAINPINNGRKFRIFPFRQNGSQVQQYAQKFISDDGKQNGLYWKSSQDQPESPLGPLAAYASAEGYSDKTKASQPFHGYFYRILTKQGDQAQEGARDYLVDGNMTGGFAILAYPAEYRNSGLMSFFINQEGTVLEKDLGDKTADVAKAIVAFNPDGTWAPVGSLAQN